MHWQTPTERRDFAFGGNTEGIWLDPVGLSATEGGILAKSIAHFLRYPFEIGLQKYLATAG